MAELWDFTFFFLLIFPYFSGINIPGQHIGADTLVGAKMFSFTGTTGVLPVRPFEAASRKCN